eukprot:jgi/Mesen1/8005/ME000425S07208
MRCEELIPTKVPAALLVNESQATEPSALPGSFKTGIQQDDAEDSRDAAARDSVEAEQESAGALNVLVEQALPRELEQPAQEGKEVEEEAEGGQEGAAQNGSQHANNQFTAGLAGETLPAGGAVEGASEGKLEQGAGEGSSSTRQAQGEESATASNSSRSQWTRDGRGDHSPPDGTSPDGPTTHGPTAEELAWENVMRINLPQPPGAPPVDFQVASSYRRLQWPRGGPPVLVVASYREFNESFPHWAHRWPLFLYQRTDPLGARFCPNAAFEGGVYLCFILEFYDNLPERVAFIQARPRDCLPPWEDWLRCLKPSASFAPLSRIFMNRDSAHFDAYWAPDKRRLAKQAVRSCWRNLGRAFETRVDPSLRIQMQVRKGVITRRLYRYVVSRELIQKNTRQQYKRAHSLVVQHQGLCHAASVEWDERGEIADLSMARASAAEVPEQNGRLRGDRAAIDRLTTGFALEGLFHHLVGKEPMVSPPWNQTRWCSQFLHEHECGAPSPCAEEAPLIMYWRNCRYMGRRRP